MLTDKPKPQIPSETTQKDTTQVDLFLLLKDTNIIFEPQITILTTIGFSVPIEEELPERVCSFHSKIKFNFIVLS